MPALPAGPLDILQAILKQLYPNEEDDGSAKVPQPKMKGEIEEVHQDQTKMQHIDVKFERIKERIKEHLLHTPKSIDNVSVLETLVLDILLHGIQHRVSRVFLGFWRGRIIWKSESYEDLMRRKIEETAKKIKELIESGSSLVGLDHQEYVRILQEMLSSPKSKEEFKPNKDKGEEDKEKEKEKVNGKGKQKEEKQE